MKALLLIGLTLATAVGLRAADASPKQTVLTAAKKLAEQPNYTWRTTIVVPDDAPFKPGPTDGKAEKGGIAWFSMSFFDNSLQAVVKGTNGAAEMEGTWKSVEELEKEEGPPQFVALIVRNLRTPAKESADLAGYTKALTKDGDAYVSELTEEGAKAMQTFRMRDEGGSTVSGAQGSVKFWLKDGALTKYEFKLKGTISFNGNDFPNERTTTVEIKDVGSTKLGLPEAARKKVGG